MIRMACKFSSIMVVFEGFLNERSTALMSEGNNKQIATVDKEQIVTFQTGGDNISVSKPLISNDPRLIEAGQEADHHSLYNFLQRPVKIGTALLNGTQNINNVVFSWDVPTQLYTVPMWADKIKGFRFFRATLNFHFLLNGNTFSAGRWLAWWSPFHDQRGSRAPILSRSHITAYPSVEIDLGSKATSHLSIPYVSPYSHIDVIRTPQPYGKLFVTVLNKLNDVTSSTTATLDIWCHLSEIHLDIPTYTDQLGVKPSQSGSEQMIRSEKGLISGAAKKVGRFAKAFSDVPAIGEVAKTVGWMSDAIAGTASMLGFSKPVSLEAVCPMSQNPIKTYTNAEGLFETNVLGTSPKNEIVPSYKCFGTDADEMDISYVVSKYAWIHTVSWSDTHASRTPRFMIPVHPGLCGDDVTGTAPVGFQTIPMSFVASMFRFWRGTINIRISLVKNPLYSGRLGIAFFAGWNVVDVSNQWNLVDLNTVPKIIWDVKEDNDITFAVPYQAQTQFSRVRLSDSFNAGTMTIDTAPGTIVVYVETPLRHPDNTPASIDMNFWAAGGHDLQFAIPDFARYQPIAMNRGPPTETLARAKAAQMFKVEKTFDHTQVDKIPEGLSLLKVSPSIPTYPSESSVGEIVDNLRLLTRRISPYSAAMKYPAYGFTLDPAWFFEPGVSAHAYGVDSRINQVPLHYISYMYVFYRGGRNYIVQKQDRGQPTTPGKEATHAIIARSDDLISGSPVWLDNPLNRYRSGQFEARSYESILPVISFTAPYYSNVPIQLVSDAWNTTAHLRMLYGIETSPYGGTSSGFDEATFQVFTGGADDFSFGYAVGTPQMYDYGA